MEKLPGDWRASFTAFLVIGVVGVLAIGIWLRPRLSALASPLVAQSSAGLAAPKSLSSAPPSFPLARPTIPTAATAAGSSAPVATVIPTVSDASPEEVPSTPARSVVAAAKVVPADDVSAIVATPTPSENVSAGTAPRAGVPILMYHYIRVNPVASDRAGFILSVTPADFARQMQLLAENGFHTVTMAQVRQYVRTGAPLPAKPIAITFDDGYGDAYTAARPVLERYHQTATFFVITGLVNQPRYLTWMQVEDLDRQGMEIGSHTVHHPSLTRLNPLELRFELATSRSELEAHLGHPVVDFCYPGGQLNPNVVTAVAAAGYLSATTTKSGLAERSSNPLELPRLRVWGGETLHQFATIVGIPGV